MKTAKNQNNCHFFCNDFGFYVKYKIRNDCTRPDNDFAGWFRQIIIKFRKSIRMKMEAGMRLCLIFSVLFMLAALSSSQAANGTWNTVVSWPTSTGNGFTITTIGNSIYALTGQSGSSSFYRYDIGTGWSSALAAVP